MQVLCIEIARYELESRNRAAPAQLPKHGWLQTVPSRRQADPLPKTRDCGASVFYKAGSAGSAISLNMVRAARCRATIQTQTSDSIGAAMTEAGSWERRVRRRSVNSQPTV